MEQALLGTMLRDNGLIDSVAAEITVETFYDPLHGRIFQTIIGMAGRAKVSALALYSAMKADAGLEVVQGLKYLEALCDWAPATHDTKHYCAVLKDLAVRRGLQDVGRDLLHGAYQSPAVLPSQALTDDATSRLLALGTSYASDRTQALSAVTAGRLRAAEKRLAGEPVPRITTGLTRLDKGMGGLQPGDHLIVAGRSGMGKTALGCSFGRAAAMDGAPVVAISADMTKERWGERTLCDVDHLLRGGVQPVRYGHFRGKMGEIQLDHLVAAQQEILNWHFDICDEGEITVARIRAKVRAMANRHPGKQGLLLTDFLQKITTDSDRRDRRRDEDITALTYAIGDIVKDVGWSAVSLAQLKNKDTDAKGKLREDQPTEADIRESGGILMAADMVIAPHRKAFFVERREPPGKDFSPEPPAEWHDWNTELQACKDEMQLIGFKNRDDSISKLNMTVWCDMGSNAIRDHRPTAPQAFAAGETDRPF